MKNLKRFKEFTLHGGHGLEQFDMALYGFLVPILAPEFFPKVDPLVQLIAGYSLLATSLISRPLGVFIFGSFALHRGASWGLSFSLFGLSLSTLVMGLLPSYGLWGWIAPLGLLLVRFAQGFFASGESALSRLFLLDKKQEAEGYKASILYLWVSMLGIILASFASTVTISEGFCCPWRLWYVLGGFLGLVVGFIRLKTDIMVPHKEQRAPLLVDRRVMGGVLWRFRKIFFLVTVTTGFSQLTYALPFVVFPSFLPLITSLSFETLIEWTPTLLILDMIMIPLVGRLIRPFNPWKILCMSSGILAFTIMPLLLGFEGATLSYVVFVRFWIIFWGVVFLCPLTLWTHSLCLQAGCENEKYMVVGLGGALGSALIGRMTPALLFWIWYETASLWVVGLYPAILFGLTLWILLGCKKIAVKPTKKCQNHQEKRRQR